MEKVIGKVGDLEVFGGKPPDLFTSWDCLEDAASQFFNDLDRVAAIEDWFRFCRDKIIDACVARNSRGKICCVSYVTAQTPRSLTFHAFSGPAYRKPTISLPAATLTIAYFFRRHGLIRLDTAGRWKNRTARMTALKLGFQHEGRLRNFLPHHGVWEDYYLASIVRP